MFRNSHNFFIEPHHIYRRPAQMYIPMYSAEILLENEITALQRESNKYPHRVQLKLQLLELRKKLKKLKSAK